MAATQPRELTQEERDRALAWVKEKMKTGHGCTFCSSNTWELHSNFVEIPVYSGSGFPATGAVVPAIMLVCPTCSHLELVSAMASGVLPKLTNPEGKPDGK